MILGENTKNVPKNHLMINVSSLKDPSDLKLEILEKTRNLLKIEISEIFTFFFTRKNLQKISHKFKNVKFCHGHIQDITIDADFQEAY